MPRFFEELFDPRKKNTYAIEALGRLVQLSRHKNQKSLVAELVRRGSATRGKAHTDLSRRWAAFRELANFSPVEQEETKLTADGAKIADHLRAIENIVSAKQRAATRSVNIFGPASLLAQFVYPKISSFYAQNPRAPGTSAHLSDIKISCWERGTKGAWFSLRDDLADIIVIRTSFLSKDLSSGEKKALHIISLGEETYSWVLPARKTLKDLHAGQIPMARIGSTEGEINASLNKRARGINWRIHVTDFSGVLNVLEADTSIGGLLPSPTADSFVKGRKNPQHVAFPCSEYPKAAISLACKKAAYASQPKVRGMFSCIST